MNARTPRLVLPLLLLALLAAPGCNRVSVGSDCVSSRDCTGAGLVCDTGAGICVECLGNADCLVEGQLCLGSSCQAVTACESSRQCPGQVCDAGRGYCVDCVGDIDCPAGQICRSSACVDLPTACQSDRECSAMGLVCETTLGQCVDCVRDADCEPGLSCRGDRTCGFVGCTPGATECDGSGARRVCGADGEWTTEACGGGEQCVGGQCFCGDGAACGAQGQCDAGTCGCGGGPSCTVDQSCVGGSCVQNSCASPCAAGEQCVGTECRCGGGPACASGARCEAGQCTSTPGCDEAPCRLTGPQCGCGAGSACTVEGESGDRRCQTAGARVEGERCSDTDRCAAGLGCLSFGTASYCMTYCSDGSRCNGRVGAGCGIPITNDGAPIANAQTCGLGCDLRTASGCPAGDACAILMPGSAGFAATVCRAVVGGLPFGCFSTEDCGVGETCRDTACESYCRVGGSDCLGGETCVALDRAPVIEGVAWGSCQAEST